MRSSRRPSPAFAVALLALVIAAGGTAFADHGASTSAVNKRAIKKVVRGQVKRAIGGRRLGRIVRRQLGKLAPGLSVASAGTATFAQNANHAQTAEGASNASAIQGAALASIAAGNDAYSAQCNPNTASFVQCGSVQLTLNREAKVLVIYGWRWSNDGSDTLALGRCRTTRNGADTSDDITMGEVLSSSPDEPVPLHTHDHGLFDNAAPPVVDVQGPLPPGTYAFGLRCNDEFGNDITYSGIRIAALVMGSD
jgi:hypothetical protein